MTLVTQFLAVQRDKLLMRLGCWLVCFSLIVGLMLPQQRVYAVEPLTMTAVAGLAAAYLGACGLSVVVSGMDKDALVSSVQRLIQEFLDTQLGGKTIQDWLGSVWDLAVIAGKIFMGRPLTDEFASFAQWVAQKYAATSGLNIITSGESLTDINGNSYILGKWISSSNGVMGTNILPSVSLDSTWSISLTSDLLLDFSYQEYSPYYVYLEVFLNGSYFGGFELSQKGYLSPSTLVCFYIDSVKYSGDLYLSLMAYTPNNGSLYSYALFALTFDLVSLGLVESSFFIDRKKEALIFAPPALEAGQGIALDVGAAATMDLDLVLQGVLDDVLAGDLTSTMEVAGEVDAPVDPPAGEITDVDGLGLPALGAALTSRFPFSIPLDFFRAVQLLAAPAKAPYFEVDFMAPLADEVGGWKGSTTVVLDFSEYAIVGQVSRWTSTIGFCLMLASATKRLIWTA